MNLRVKHNIATYDVDMPEDATLGRTRHTFHRVKELWIIHTVYGTVYSVCWKLHCVEIKISWFKKKLILLFIFGWNSLYLRECSILHSYAATLWIPIHIGSVCMTLCIRIRLQILVWLQFCKYCTVHCTVYGAEASVLRIPSSKMRCSKSVF